MLGLDLYGASLYAAVAFLLVFATVRAIFPYRKVIDAYRVAEFFLVFSVIVIASFYISTRPFDMEGDTAVYINFFNDFNAGLENPFQTFEPGFIGLVRFFGYLGLDYQSFFYVVAFLFLWSYYFLIKSVFGRRSVWTLYVFGFLLFYPFFFSLTANIIRQGFALSFINIALACSVGGYWLRGSILTVCAALFHKSSIVYFPFFLFRRLILKFGVYSVVALWLVVSLASYLKLFNLIVVLLFDFMSGYGLVINYSDVDNIDYMTGFRWDFWLFSSLAVFLLVALKVLGCLSKKEAYIFYVCAYLSCLHIAMFDVAYNDRFGIYSWIFYPLELGYVLRAVGENVINGSRRNATQDTAA